jgi:hypothetical protein
MGRWLQGAAAGIRREERGVTPDPPPDVLVFHQRTPEGAVSAAQLTENWIAAARFAVHPITFTPFDGLWRLSPILLASLYGLLYGLSPFDPLSYSVVVGLLAAAGVVAVAIPAWRSTRVNPIVALRHE